MCSINLQAIMTNKTYPVAGEILFDMLAEKIKSENKIVLDLDGVVSLPSMFLNMSIGRFLKPMV